MKIYLAGLRENYSMHQMIEATGKILVSYYDCVPGRGGFGTHKLFEKLVEIAREREHLLSR